MKDWNYTIPSDNRELQLACPHGEELFYYTIPSDNRELQLGAVVTCDIAIIPYQVITGNYNSCAMLLVMRCIIPYQVITGNYNEIIPVLTFTDIIPYQVITGNYNGRTYQR